MGDSAHRISVRPDHVLVDRSDGYEVVLSEQPELLMELAAVCKDAGCRRVLIRGPRTTVRLSTVDIFELGENIARLGLRIAVVERHDTTTENVEFLEAVASNRGGAIQFFVDEQDAKDWLGIN